MIIDVVFAILILLACIKGYSKGFIVALFSIIGFIVGIAAALKLSSFVSDKLSASVSISAKWLPFVSFLLVFIVVVILIRLGARLVQRSVEMLMLGWANKLGGIILYAFLYTILLSIFLFYAVQLHLISATTVSASQVYPWVQPLGPWVINSLGKIIPLFKNMFSTLEEFFGKLPPKA